MMAVAVPAVFVLLHLDRAADRPERLRGLSNGAAEEAQAALPAPATLPG
jgi:hypothetical protein